MIKLKKIYDKILNLLSEQNKNTIINIFNYLSNGLEASIILEKHSQKKPEKNNSYFLVEEKMKEYSILLEVFRNSFELKIQTQLNNGFNFETILDLNLMAVNEDLDSISFSFNNTNKNISLYLHFNKNYYYSVNTIKPIKSSLLNDGNQMIENDKNKEIINMVLNHFKNPSELKDFLLINCDIKIEKDEVLSNIYKHSLLINNNPKIIKKSILKL